MDQFDAETINEIKSTFDLYDKTGKGEIDQICVGEAIRSLGYNPTQEVLSKALNNAELKNMSTQFVKLNDFYPMLISVRAANEDFQDEEFIEALKVFDRKSNGVISSAELRYALTAMGEPLTKNEMDRLINEFEDSSGCVNYHE